MGYDFNNPAAHFVYNSASKIYVQKPIMIYWVYALVIRWWLWHTLNPQWTKYAIVTHPRNCLEKHYLNNSKNIVFEKNAPLNISSKFSIYLYRWKSVDPPLAESEVRKMLLWWCHIEKFIAIEYLSVICLGGMTKRLQCMSL